MSCGCGDNNAASFEEVSGRNFENFSNLIGHGLRGSLGETRKSLSLTRE
jgi:hypothetical protein